MLKLHPLRFKLSTSPCALALCALLAMALAPQSFAQEGDAADPNSDEQSDAAADDAKSADEDDAPSGPIGSWEASDIKGWRPIYGDERDTITLDMLDDEIRARFSRLGTGVAYDPSGRHNIQAIKQFPIKPELSQAEKKTILDDRHEYVREMLLVMNVWIDAEHTTFLGSVLDKQKQALGDDPTYQFFVAFLSWYAPRAVDDLERFKQTVTAFIKAVDKDKDFAIARVYYADFQIWVWKQSPSHDLYRSIFGEDGKLYTIEELVNRALELRPGYGKALFLRAYWVAETTRPTGTKDDQVREDCKAILNANTSDEHMLIDAADLFLGITDIEAATAYFNELLTIASDTTRKDYSRQWHARVLFFVALLQLEQKLYLEAKSTGEAALKLLKQEQDEGRDTALLRYGVRTRILNASLLGLISEKRRADESDGVAELYDQVEESLRICVELDLEHFKWDSNEKAASVYAMAKLLVLRRDVQAAIEAVEDYDKRATRLKFVTRASLRYQLDTLRLQANGDVPIAVWLARGNQAFLIEKYEELASFAKEEPEHYKLLSAEVFAAFVDASKSDNLQLARVSSNLLGIAASRSDASAEQKSEARESIYSALVKHALVLSIQPAGVAPNPASVGFASLGISSLKGIGGRASARALLNYLNLAAKATLPPDSTGDLVVQENVHYLFRQGLRTVKELVWADEGDMPRKVRRAVGAKLNESTGYAFATQAIYTSVATPIEEAMDELDAAGE